MRLFPPPQRRESPIERTEQVEHHRWTPPPPDPRGLAPLDGPTRALLHQMRWRKAPPDRRRRWTVLGVVLALHLLFGLLTWQEMQMSNRVESSRARHDALQVRLISRPPPAAVPMAPTEAALPPPPPPRRPVVREPPARNAMTASMPEPAAASTVAPKPQLYDATGQLSLPASAASAPAAAPDYVQRVPQGDSKVMKHDSPITYKATRFDKDWAPGHGNSSLDDGLQRAVDKTTVTHTFHVAPGVRIHCAVTLAALAGGCGIGDPPRKPSGKSSDMRLNMAPANLAAPAASAPKPPSIDECIAIYRADKPLPQGCPVDTPTRSVDAEMRERANHQGEQGGG